MTPSQSSSSLSESPGPAKRAKKSAKKAPARRPPKPRFGPRGQRLWDAHRKQAAGEGGLVLLEEACRIADRLDKLDALLKGDADVWCRLVVDVNSDGTKYELRITSALIEARQQANVLRQIIAGLPVKEADDGDDDGAWVDEVPA